MAIQQEPMKIGGAYMYHGMKAYVMAKFQGIYPQIIWLDLVQHSVDWYMKWPFIFWEMMKQQMAN